MFKKRFPLYAALASTWLILLALNLGGPRSGSAGFSTGVSPYTYLLNQARMSVHYLQVTIWPTGLVLDYGRTRPTALSDVAPYVFVIVALLSVVAALWKYERRLAYLGTWFFLTLAPTSSFVPIASEVGAERRMYLPLAALSVAFVTVIARRFRHSPLRLGMLAGLFGVITLVLAGLTVQRNRDYQDPIRMWQTVIERYPHGRAHYNLALALKESGNTTDALSHYRVAIADEPNAYYGLGFEKFQAGQFKEASDDLAEFLRRRPADEAAPKAWLLLGDSRTRLQMWDRAEEAYGNAIKQSPGLADAHGALADLLYSRNRYAEAITAYRRYLALVPASGSASAHHSIGLALVALGQEPDALAEFQQAVAANLANPEMRRSLATALTSQNQCDAAVPHYRAALAGLNIDASVMSALGLCLAKTGQQSEALVWFKRALTLEPRNQAVLDDYALAAGELRLNK